MDILSNGMQTLKDKKHLNNDFTLWIMYHKGKEKLSKKRECVSERLNKHYYFLILLGRKSTVFR